MDMGDAFEKVTRSLFQREHPERWSVKSMGSQRWPRETRWHKVRCSHHGFTQNMIRQQDETVQQSDNQKAPIYPIISSFEHDNAWGRLEYRKNIACDRMKDASAKLKHLRLTSRVSQEELHYEVKLIHAQETLQVLCRQLCQPAVVPPEYPDCAASVTLRDMTFSIRKYPDADPYWNEHFFCLFIQGTDVRASRLTNLRKDVAKFTENFRFTISADTFAIDVKVYSIKEKPRTALGKTKLLLQKVFSSREVVPSNCIYHGCMKITEKHLQDDTGALFEHEELSRIGKVSLQLTMTKVSQTKA